MRFFSDVCRHKLRYGGNTHNTNATCQPNSFVNLFHIIFTL